MYWQRAWQEVLFCRVVRYRKCLGLSIGRKFDDMEERLFVEEITGDTLSLHFYLADPENYGIEDYEVTLGGYSIEHVEESYEEIRQIQEELHGMNYKLLTKEQQLTYEVLDYYLDTELNSEGFELYSNPLKPTIGQQVELPLMFADYMFYDRRDVEDYCPRSTTITERLWTMKG